MLMYTGHVYCSHGKGRSEMKVNREVTGRRLHNDHTLVTKLSPFDHKEGGMKKHQEWNEGADEVQCDTEAQASVFYQSCIRYKSCQLTH